MKILKRDIFSLTSPNSDIKYEERKMFNYKRCELKNPTDLVIFIGIFTDRKKKNNGKRKEDKKKG